MALYNNGYPATYVNPYLAQPQYQAPQQQQNTGIIWVQGEAGAKSYLVAPNTTVQLWDSEKQVIYLKSADGSGMPSMKVLDYTIRENNAPVRPTDAPTQQIDLGQYVTREELKSLSEQITALKTRIEKLDSKEDRE